MLYVCLGCDEVSTCPCRPMGCLCLDGCCCPQYLVVGALEIYGNHLQMPMPGNLFPYPPLSTSSSAVLLCATRFCLGPSEIMACGTFCQIFGPWQRVCTRPAGLVTAVPVRKPDPLPFLLQLRSQAASSFFGSL